MADRAAARTATVWQALRQFLEAQPADRPLDVLDAGGGSGSFAVPFAELGHRVTVVDPSPDSLAALERRAADAGVSGRITARQGDAAGLLDVVPATDYDLVLCHSVLEVVDDPAASLAAVAAVTRPAGAVSVLAATRVAAVLSRVLAGRLAEAVAMLDDPAGRGGPADPLLRRFHRSELLAVLDAAGLVARQVHGVRVFADLLAGPVPESEPVELAALQARVAEDPEFFALAAQLHVLAVPRREAAAG